MGTIDLLVALQLETCSSDDFFDFARIGERKHPALSHAFQSLGREQREQRPEDRCDPRLRNAARNHDYNRPSRDASRLDQRSYLIVGELERTESRDPIERPVWPRQLFEVSNAKVAIRRPLGGDLDEFLGGVDPRDFHPAIGGHTCEAAGTAPTIK
jgi:hypothetical protein